MFNRREFTEFLAAGLILTSVAPHALAQGASLSSIKIATIGAGREGGALGTLFAKLGHPVLFSSRHPEELKDLVAAAGPTARAGTTAEAVAFGDVIIVAVPYGAMESIGQELGSALAAKPLVLDPSNPGAMLDKVASEGGAGLVTARLLKGAHIVRGFNGLSYAQLPSLAHQSGERVGVPIAGDDAKAVDLASRLIREAGFEPVLIGGLAKGRYLLPRTPPLSGVHTAAELRQIAATLN